MKKLLLFTLICALLLPFGGCRAEEIPATPLRALTFVESFAYDCDMVYKQEIYETVDMNMSYFEEYTREGAEPVRVLRLFDQEWQLQYQTTRPLGLVNGDKDLYVAGDGSGMTVEYLAGTEEIIGINFGSDAGTTLWKPENFTPDEAGLLAYAYHICAYYGIDTSDYVVEYDFEGWSNCIVLMRYLQSTESTYFLRFYFTKEGNLRSFRLPGPGWGTVAIEERDLALFTDENIVNAVKHRIYPYLEDGVDLTQTMILGKSFFLRDGKLYLFVKMDFEYKRSDPFIDRKEHRSGGFASDFVIEIA